MGHFSKWYIIAGEMCPLVLVFTYLPQGEWEPWGGFRKVKTKVIFILLLLDKYYFLVYSYFGGEKNERCNVNKDRKIPYAKD